jgi:hypothetical protein
MASPKFESLIKYIIKKKMMAFPSLSHLQNIIKKKIMTFPKFESVYVLCLCELFGIHLCIVLISICINYFSFLACAYWLDFELDILKFS